MQSEQSKPSSGFTFCVIFHCWLFFIISTASVIGQCIVSPHQTVHKRKMKLWSWKRLASLMHLGCLIYTGLPKESVFYRVWIEVNYWNGPFKSPSNKTKPVEENVNKTQSIVHSTLMKTRIQMFGTIFMN